jgi:hypothetical protein
VTLDELAIAQRDLARGDLSPAESRSCRRSQRNVSAEWTRLRELATRCLFRLGSVEAAVLRGVPASWSALFDAAPDLVSIDIEKLDVDLVVFANRSEWSRVRGLATSWSPMLHVLAGTLGEIRAFEMRRAVWDELVVELFAGMRMAKLEILRLPDHPLKPDTVTEVVRHAPNVRVLDLASVEAELSCVAAVPASVRQLHIGGKAAITLAEIVDTAFAPTLEKLDLDNVDLRWAPGLLASLPSLRSLDLLDARPTRKLADVALPQLRELRLPHELDLDVVRALAAAFGPQLELLDVRGLAVEPIIDELEKAVAGDVWTGRPDPRRALLAASYATHEPMWDLATVDL